MRSNIFRRICKTLAIPTVLLTSQTLTASQALDYMPVPAAETSEVKNQEVRGYFVRFSDLPMSQWVKQRESAGAPASREERLERVVGLKNKLASVAGVFEAAGIRVGRSILVADVGFIVYATASQLEALGAVEGVQAIVPNTVYKRQSGAGTVTPATAGRLSQQSAWTGAGQTIAIIDDGIDYTHKDFGGMGDFLTNDPDVIEGDSFPTSRVVGGADFVGKDYNLGSLATRVRSPDLDPLPDNLSMSHGTLVAGIAAGKGFGDIGPGIAPDANLLALKVNSPANVSSFAILLAIDLAMDPNEDGDPSDAVDVVNLSLGIPFGNPNGPLSVAVQSLIDSGIVVVAAAGNSGALPFVIGSPGVRPEVISVAASEFNKEVIWRRSSGGPGLNGGFKPDISAPGQGITSAKVGSGDGYSTVSGTSFAAPVVAGAAALLRQKFPKLDPKAVKALLQNSSKPIKPAEGGGKTPLSRQGTGVVDVEKALQASSYAMPGGIGFGILEPEYYADSKKEFTLTNFSEQDKLYQISHEPNLRLPEGALQLSFSEHVFVPAGQSVAVPVTLHIHAQYTENHNDLAEADGWLVASSGEEELRVGYMAVVKPTARLEYIRNNKNVNVRNDAFAEAQVYPFTLIKDNSAQAFGGNDIQSFGFRSLGSDKVAFGMKLNQEWLNFSNRELRMFIRRQDDGDDVWDFMVTVEDEAGALSDVFNEPSGNIVTTVRSIDKFFNPTNDFFAQYLTPLAKLNSSVLVFDLELYGEKGLLQTGGAGFDYAIAVRDVSTGFGNLLSGSVDLNQEIAFDTDALATPVTSEGSVNIGVAGGGSSLWLSPTEQHERNVVILP